MKLCITITLCTLLFLADPALGSRGKQEWNACVAQRPSDRCTERNLVCGTDGVEYTNICDFCDMRQNSGRYDIEVHHYGECPRG